MCCIQYDRVIHSENGERSENNETIQDQTTQPKQPKQTRRAVGKTERSGARNNTTRARTDISRQKDIYIAMRAHEVSNGTRERERRGEKTDDVGNDWCTPNTCVRELN